jgi:hypothetical protein
MWKDSEALYNIEQAKKYNLKIVDVNLEGQWDPWNSISSRRRLSPADFRPSVGHKACEILG